MRNFLDQSCSFILTKHCSLCLSDSGVKALDIGMISPLRKIMALAEKQKTQLCLRGKFLRLLWKVIELTKGGLVCEWRVCGLHLDIPFILLGYSMYVSTVTLDQLRWEHISVTFVCLCFFFFFLPYSHCESPSTLDICLL